MCCLRGIAVPMHPTKQFVGDFWFVEAGASNQQAAVADQIPLSTPLNGEETKTSLVRLHALRGEASLGFGDGERGPSLVFTEQFEIPRRIFLITQPQGEPFRLD